MAFEFVRLPTDEDRRNGVPQGYSFWLDTDSKEEGWFAPADVLTRGLTDRMRTALQEAERELVGPGVPLTPVPEAFREPPEPQRGPDPADPTREGFEVLGGHTKRWRWQRVVDGDRVLWAIDNKPAFQDLGLDEEPPEFMHVVLPDEIVQTIARGTPPA